MADFWIKVEKGTPDKPEVLQMAAILDIEDPDTVTGKLVRVWSWFDSNSANGHAPSVTNVLLDRLTGVQGFCDAMISVGWLIKTEDGFTVPNHERHLGQTAKKRGLDAERKRKSREVSRTKADKSGTESGLDKREIREDKDKKVKQARAPSCPYQKIADIYNETLPEIYPRVVSMKSKERQRLAKGLYSALDSDLEKVQKYFSYLADNLNDFHRGENDRGWIADIEFMMRDKTILKAREGNL